MGYEIYGVLKFEGLSNFGGFKPMLKWLNYWVGPDYMLDLFNELIKCLGFL